MGPQVVEGDLVEEEDILRAQPVERRERDVINRQQHRHAKEAILEAALDGLNPMQERALALRVGLGISVHATARQIGVHASTVHRWEDTEEWARAREALAQHLRRKRLHLVELAQTKALLFTLEVLSGHRKGSAKDYLMQQASAPIVARLFNEEGPQGVDALVALAPSDPDIPLAPEAAAELAEALDIRSLALPASTPEPPAATETLVSVSGEHDAEVLEALDATPDPLDDLRPSPWTDEGEDDAGDGWRSWR